MPERFAIKGTLSHEDIFFDVGQLRILKSILKRISPLFYSHMGRKKGNQIIEVRI